MGSGIYDDSAAGASRPPEDGWGAWLVYPQADDYWRCGLSLHGHVLMPPVPPEQRITKSSTGWKKIDTVTLKETLIVEKKGLLRFLRDKKLYCIASLLETNMHPTKEEFESALVVDALADWSDEKPYGPDMIVDWKKKFPGPVVATMMDIRDQPIPSFYSAAWTAKVGRWTIQSNKPKEKTDEEKQ